MKKILFSICLAALAIGCAKTEVSYEMADSISFAPVAQVATKVAYDEASELSTPLIVSATAGLGDDKTKYTEEYFNEVVFTKTSDVYTSLGYYWPNVKYLTFAGITQSKGITTDNVTISVPGTVENTADATPYNIKVTEYTQQEINVDNDLMWFQQTTPQGKATPTCEVDMNHACSWIVLKFIGGENVANATRKWRITNITINALSDKETAWLTDNAVWSETGSKTKSLVIYDDGSKTEGGEELESTAFVPSANGIIVIPQTPSTLSITYNYVSQFGTDDTTESDDIVIEETATVSLDYDGVEATNTKWAAGKKYTYDVTIGATKIEIAPSASTWVNYDSDPDDVDKENKPVDTPIPGTI